MTDISGVITLWKGEIPGRVMLETGRPVDVIARKGKLIQGTAIMIDCGTPNIRQVLIPDSLGLSVEEYLQAR